MTVHCAVFLQLSTCAFICIRGNGVPAVERARTKSLRVSRSGGGRTSLQSPPPVDVDGVSPRSRRLRAHRRRARRRNRCYECRRDVAQRAARLLHAIPVPDSAGYFCIPQLQTQIVVELRRWCVNTCPLGTRVLINAAASLLYSFSSFDASGRAAASGRGFPSSSSSDRSALAAMRFSASAASLRGSKPPVLSQARRPSQRCSCKERLFMRDPRTSRATRPP